MTQIKDAWLQKWLVHPFHLLLSVSPNIWSSLHFYYMFYFPDEAINQQTDVNLPALVAGRQKHDYQLQQNLVFIAPKCKRKRNPWSRIIPAQRPLPLDTIDVFPVKRMFRACWWEDSLRYGSRRKDGRDGKHVRSGKNLEMISILRPPWEHLLQCSSLCCHWWWHTRFSEQMLSSPLINNCPCILNALRPY